MKKFKEFIEYTKKQNRCNLFMDIETLQYNEIEGYKKPSLFKNVTYSVAVSYFYNNEEQPSIAVFPNFKEFFETLFFALKNKKTGYISSKCVYSLIFHNGNKYDHHFLLHDLQVFYNMRVENIFLKNALDNQNTLKIKDLTKEDKKNIILEKRVKSSNNLELDFFLKGVRFKTVDSLMKTNMSLESLGKKLYDKKLIKKSELKTDYNYIKYNTGKDMEEKEARKYAEYVFYNLTEDEMTYIRNDVIILAKAWKYYSIIFPNFDFDKITFTQNILESYNTNDLTSFQLLGKLLSNKKFKINYTEYQFANENLYDYLKPFYRGGLNFYNEKYLGKIINDPMVSFDINSSYPFCMDNFPIPTFLKWYDEFEKPQLIKTKINNSKIYQIYRMTKTDFNNEILLNIQSKIMKKILVKYYSTNEYVNINSYTLKMIENVCHIDCSKISVLSYMEYDCVYFGSREKLFDFYNIKVNGKSENLIKMKDPYIYEVTEMKNQSPFTPEEIYNAKVMLNGLYGIPALRAYFNVFRRNKENELENQKNGYKNSERNIVFSIFVTSVALYNLLDPLKFLTQKQIDEYFVYTDTDSLYLMREVMEFIPKNYFDPIALGRWDIENELIEKFYVLNHKKYCYFAYDDDIGKKRIFLHCGGIPLESFDTDMIFENFVKTQFSNGCQIKNKKSILNKQGTISIYNSKTLIDIGKKYKTYFSERDYKEKQELLEKIRNEDNDNLEDIIYIESNIGTFSQSDIYPVKHDRGEKELWLLRMIHNKIKNMMGELE